MVGFDDKEMRHVESVVESAHGALPQDGEEYDMEESEVRHDGAVSVDALDGAGAPDGGAAGGKGPCKRRVSVLKGLAVAIVALLAVTALVFAVGNAVHDRYAGLSDTATEWDGTTAGAGGSKGESASTRGEVADTAANGAVSSSDGGNTASQSSGDMGMDSDTMVKQGTVNIVTENYDDTFASISALVSDTGSKVISRHDKRGGGWVYGSTGKIEKSKTARQLDLTLEVPNDQVYRFIDEVTMIDGVEVEALSVDAEDVSGEIEGYDRASQDISDEIAEVKAQMEAEGVSEADKKALGVKLAELEREAIRLANGQKQLQDAIDMSEIQLRVREQVNPTGTDALSSALSGSFDSFVSTMSSALAIVVWMLPYLLLLLVFVAIVVAASRWSNHRAARARNGGGTASAGDGAAVDAGSGAGGDA